MSYTAIAATGRYLPPHVMTNEDWEKRVDTSDEWIRERTGIISRHIAGENETAATMATEAAKEALRKCGYAPQSIELIIVATGTSDKIFPTTACFVQKYLEIPDCIAFDIGAACTGFIYALSVADQFIKNGTVKRALVIGVEMMSRVIDWSDRNTCVLFGDGAGAVIVEASEKPGIISTDLYAQGSYDDLLYVDSAQMGDHTHVNAELKTKSIPNFNKPLENLYPYVRMQGQKVFKVAVTKFGDMAKQVLEKNHLTPDQIDWLIPHQANMRIIQLAAEKVGVPMEKVVCTVATHSNTSSASIPLALDVAVSDNRIKRGQLLLMEAFGAGLTWGSALVRF